MIEPSLGVPESTRDAQPLKLVAVQRDPFAGASKGFFEGGGRGSALEELRHLGGSPHRIIAVTGERGVGKSALFRALSGHLETGVKAARINANLTSDAREVLAGVLQGFGVAAPARASAQLLAELVVVHAEEQASARRQCLVLVDDAHLLELRALEQLLKLVDATSDEALRVVFFAENELEPALERACRRMTNARGWHAIRVPPLAEAETRAYLRFRLAEAGVTAMPYSRSQLETIHRRSRGLPARVNAVAREVIDAAALVEPAHRLPRGHRAVVLLIAAATLSFWLVWNNWSRHAGDASISSATADPSRAVVALPLPASREHGPAEPMTQAAARESALGATDAGEAVEQSRPALDPAEPVLATPGETGAAAVLPGQAPEAPVPSRATPPVTIPDGPQQTRTAPPILPAPAAQSARGTDWVRAQPRTHWTLQLFGTSNRDAWNRYLREHAKESVAGYETRRDSAPWYVVVYGSFATEGEADAAARKLPASLGRVQPWKRSFGAIQDTLAR